MDSILLPMAEMTSFRRMSFMRPPYRGWAAGPAKKRDYITLNCKEERQNSGDISDFLLVYDEFGHQEKN